MSGISRQVFQLDVYVYAAVHSFTHIVNGLYTIASVCLFLK